MPPILCGFAHIKPEGDWVTETAPNAMPEALGGAVLRK